MTPDTFTPAEMQKLLEYIERTECTVTDDCMKDIVAYIRSLEADHREMKRALKDVSVMQAEDNFKSWKDKVNDVQTWQEQFFNEVILKPVNEYAKEVLSSLHLK